MNMRVIMNVLIQLHRCVHVGGINDTGRAYNVPPKISIGYSFDLIDRFLFMSVSSSLQLSFNSFNTIQSSHSRSARFD
jgi:hypothetical protein